MNKRALFHILHLFHEANLIFSGTESFHAIFRVCHLIVIFQTCVKLKIRTKNLIKA